MIAVKLTLSCGNWRRPWSRTDALQEHLPCLTPTKLVLAHIFTARLSTWFGQACAGQVYIGNVQLSASDDPYIILAMPAADHGVVAARLLEEGIVDWFQKPVSFAILAETIGKALSHG